MSPVKSADVRRRAKDDVKSKESSDAPFSNGCLGNSAGSSSISEGNACESKASTDCRVENIAVVSDEKRRHPSGNKLFGVFPIPGWAWLHEPECFVSPTKKGTSVHQMADSLFSSTSGFSDFTGFLNLGIILLVLSNTRVALENVIKYGILITPVDWMEILFVDPYNWPSFSLVLFSNVFILSVFVTEKLVSKDKISGSVCRFLNVAIISLEITFPAAVIWHKHPNPAFSCICLAIYVILFLKLISYVQVNSWCRLHEAQQIVKRKRNRQQSVGSNLKNLGKLTALPDADDDDDDANDDSDGLLLVEKVMPAQQYPNNLRLADLYYFLLAPTLCYELHFPRSVRIRKRFLIKRIFEMVFIFGLMLSLIQQWIQPTVRNSMVPFHKMHIMKVVERLLKLAVPNHIIWLLFFYWFFHSCLNVLAEILRFGDRTFYRDWWNAQTVQYFWQNWNIPVHRWAVRHLYKPMLTFKFTRTQANIAVFLLSAFFHEYLVSIPLQMFRTWAFFAMILQVPMAYVVSNYLHGRYGNMAVWISLILGQPVAVLMYFHDYFILNRMGGEEAAMIF